MQDICSADLILECARTHHQHAEVFFPCQEEIADIFDAIMLNLETRGQETSLFFEQRLTSFNALIQQFIPHASLGMSTPEKAAIDDQALALLEAVMHQVKRGEVQVSAEGLANAVLQGLSVLKMAKEEGKSSMLTNFSQAFLLSDTSRASRTSQVRGTLFAHAETNERESQSIHRGLGYSNSLNEDV